MVESTPKLRKREEIRENVDPTVVVAFLQEIGVAGAVEVGRRAAGRAVAVAHAASGNTESGRCSHDDADDDATYGALLLRDVSEVAAAEAATASGSTVFSGGSWRRRLVAVARTPTGAASGCPQTVMSVYKSLCRMASSTPARVARNTFAVPSRVMDRWPASTILSHALMSSPLMKSPSPFFAQPKVSVVASDGYSFAHNSCNVGRWS